MKLKEIRLKNFRCYEDLTVPLDEKLTVLVAPNGQGKTAILDAISIALWDFVKKFDLAKPYPAYNIGISKDDIRIIGLPIPHHKDIEDIEEYHLYGGIARQLNTEIIATNTQNFIWMRYKDSEVAGSRTKEDKKAKELQNKAKEIQRKIRINNPDEEPQSLPLFSYYGTGRLWDKKRLMERLKQNKNDEKIRTFAYQNSLDPASNYKQFENWFINKYMQLEREARIAWEMNKQGSKPYDKIKSEISNINQSIDKVLKIVGWENPEYSEIFDKEIVLHHKKYGTLKLDQLSDGIQNVFGMVADIAYRCYLLNSHLGENAAKETEGIVLIDEVDMHLHPEWQQVILRDLQEAFPNLQFIVTTHSPQVLSSIKKEHIRILKDEQISQPNELMETYGELSSNVLHEIMEVDPRPPIKERNDLNKLTILVDSGQYNTKEAISLLGSLKSDLGENHEAIRRIERSIKRQQHFADLLRDKK